MPFQMKIQPIFDSQTTEEPRRFKPQVVVKSRLKRLFERQFSNVLLRASEKVAEFEPSSACLDKMVQSFIEQSNNNNNEKQSGGVKCGRNCFNLSSDDDLDSNSGESTEAVKSLAICASVGERTLLADASMIVEKNSVCKRKDDFCRGIVVEGLLSLGYDAAICRSRWEKSPSYPAGEYEYIDVLIRGERLLLDIDFRSEFEIARPTKAYRSILNALPHIFVGKSDRLHKIIGFVSDAAKQSLNNKGMHVPPWRKAEYVRSKWLSPHVRLTRSPDPPGLIRAVEPDPDPSGSDGDEAGLEFEESVFAFSESLWEGERSRSRSTAENGAWRPPEIKCRSSRIGAKLVTGLSSVMG